MKLKSAPYLLMLAVSAALLGACGENTADAPAASASVSEPVSAPEASAAETPLPASEASEAVFADTEHSAENALDWAGTYTGTLPCTSCESIRTTLVLNNDQTYALTEDYQGGKTPSAFEESGRFEWEKGGSVIRLLPNGANQASSKRYFVAEGHILQLAEGEHQYRENSAYRLEQQAAQ